MEEFEDQIETWTVVVDADTRSLQKELANASGFGRQFSRSLIGAFNGIAAKGKGLSDVLRKLALDLSNVVLKAALRPLEKGLDQVFSGLLSGGLGLGGGAPAALPVPFAKGGVIQNPVTFPLGRGGVGLAGERGAEAIMPLARSADGRLGVVAQGGSSASNITINISTPDAESFRRSQSQVAATLSRAVSMGQRNL